MAGAFGAFGKMPSLGDFFRTDIAASFVDPWDLWLQEGMLAASTSLTDRWEGCYMSAPIWQFTLSPGLAGPGAMIGVLMASVDRVGRKFPLTLAAPIPDQNAALTHFQSDELFHQLENLALDALDDTMTRDALAKAMAAIQTPAVTVQPVTHRSAGQLSWVGQTAPGPHFAASAVQGFQKPSIWSAHLNGNTQLMVTEGLPSPLQLTALFDPAASLWLPHSVEASA